MRHFSIKQQLAVLIVFAFVVSFLIGTFQIRSVQHVSEGLEGAIKSSKILRNHLEADMMHDALRADVIAALYDASQGGKDKKEILEGLADHSDHFQSMIKENDSMPLTPLTRKALDDVKPALDSYVSSAGKITNLAYSDYEKGKGELPKFLEAFEVLEGKMADLSNTIQGDAAKEKAIASESSQTNLKVSLFAVFAMGAFAIVSLWVLGSRINKRAEDVKDAAKELENSVIGPLTEALHNLAAGNLAYRPQIEAVRMSQGPRDEIASAFDSMADRTEEMVGAYDAARTGLSNTVSKMSSGAEKLALASESMKNAVDMTMQTSTEIARGSESLAEATTSTAQSLEQLHKSIETAANGSMKQLDTVEESLESLTSANQALDMVNQTSGHMADNAKQGSAAVAKTVGAMESISKQADQSLTVVQDLKEKSHKIGSIVKAIEDVAAQTNLLSLNASIEAARAGEHGRGFAVVADEVRKLSQEASDAAKEIGLLINDVTSSVNEVVHCVEEMRSEVVTGVGLTKETGSILSVIVESINGTVDQILVVSSEAEATSKKMVALQQVATNGNKIAQEMRGIAGTVSHSANSSAAISEESSACAEELRASTTHLAAAAEDLEAISAELREAATKFVIDEKNHLKLAA
ncbi:MAG: hypothetical protein GC165_10865 [Armatimonadetes bacterium]|nr:hypothetical protein [Armatimonadota bacterium]MBS1728376.1 hypothetical protein [Armatimonadota bacterium]